MLIRALTGRVLYKSFGGRPLNIILARSNLKLSKSDRFHNNTNTTINKFGGAYLHRGAPHTYTHYVYSSKSCDFDGGCIVQIIRARTPAFRVAFFYSYSIQ